MTKKTKPAEQQKAPPPRKRRRWTPEELREIVELAQVLKPRRHRIKVETVPFGTD